MDFISLGENSRVHIVREKPYKYEIGVLKSKTQKQANPYIPNQQQTIDVVVSVNGNDEIIPSVGSGMETVKYHGSYYSTNHEGVQQVIANLIQVGKNGLAEQQYYNTLVVEGEKDMEKLNPQFAENRKQARVVKELQERADAQDKKLDKILSFMQDLTGPKK